MLTHSYIPRCERCRVCVCVWRGEKRCDCMYRHHWVCFSSCFVCVPGRKRGPNDWMVLGVSLQFFAIIIFTISSFLFPFLHLSCSLTLHPLVIFSDSLHCLLLTLPPLLVTFSSSFSRSSWLTIQGLPGFSVSSDRPLSPSTLLASSSSYYYFQSCPSYTLLCRLLLVRISSYIHSSELMWKVSTLLYLNLYKIITTDNSS